MDTTKAIKGELVRPAVAARRLRIPAADLVERIAAAKISPALVIEGRSYFKLDVLQAVAEKSSSTL